MLRLYWYFSYLRTIVFKCGPDLVVFLNVLFVVDFILYLSVEFVEQVLWKIIVLGY